MRDAPDAAAAPVRPTIDSLLLAATRIATFEHQRGLTNASGFFFERDGRLYLVTSRHVLIDKPSKHHPNRIEIEVHTQGDDLAKSARVSLLLYKDGRSQWRQGTDSSGGTASAERKGAALTGAQYQEAFFASTAWTGGASRARWDSGSAEYNRATRSLRSPLARRLYAAFRLDRLRRRAGAGYRDVARACRLDAPSVSATQPALPVQQRA